MQYSGPDRDPYAVCYASANMFLMNFRGMMEAPAEGRATFAYDQDLLHGHAYTPQTPDVHFTRGMACIDCHYAGESQTLTVGAEENLLKLAEIRGRRTPLPRPTPVSPVRSAIRSGSWVISTAWPGCTPTGCTRWWAG